VKVKSKLKLGVLKVLKDRLFSFGIILSLGFVLLISLIVDVLITTLKEFMASHFSPDFALLAQMSNTIVSFVVITGIFVLIYRFLPDVNVRWSASFFGAIITSVLFSGGKFLIGFILGRSNLGMVYGAASSFIGILVWIYYASLIFYFGVELCRQFSIYYNHENKPVNFAIPFEIKPIEQSNK
jgi:membrane protein